MFVTMHARARLHARLGKNMRLMGAIVGRLEAMPGEPGTIAYVAAVLNRPIDNEDGSNGDHVIALAVDGSVSTVYLRRGEQALSPEFFGAERVVWLRETAAWKENNDA